ncbi:MAG: magnesium/cobalt transporter CorA [Thermoanaerobaculia bacterium]|nr:magnesium/cobalt transporter CorA [Thermoanaerobaculia bacterium]
MARKIQEQELGRMAQRVGMAPGLLSVDPSWPEPRLTFTAYDPGMLVEREVAIDELKELIDAHEKVWVDVEGLGSEAVLQSLAESLELHKLALEDVVNLGQRAKVEPYQEDLFIVVRSPIGSSGATEQLALILGPGYLLTFQERRGDCFEPVRVRLRHGKGRLRGAGLDYLTYALVDAVIDSYFPVVEEIADELERLEADVLEDPDRKTVSAIHDVKRRIQGLRRAIWPHREALNTLLRDAGAFVSEETLLYLRDCYDHTIRIAEMIDAQRDHCTDLMATYLSVVSNRMNEVMKVLAIIGTIFIPLGFIAGLYGMNFDPDVSPWNMPELSWFLGYPYALGLMGLTVLGMMAFFWRKGWFK